MTNQDYIEYARSIIKNKIKYLLTEDRINIMNQVQVIIDCSISMGQSDSGETIDTSREGT